MKIVCISDTHNCNEQIAVPDGDILIHSGDALISGALPELKRFAGWFGSLPHKVKIFVAGNHDWAFQREPASARKLLPSSVVYLQDSFVEIEGLKIYGSPWQPRFYDWAFNLMRGAEMAERWALIPDDTDILITHGPPHGILDIVETKLGTENAGCEGLRKRVETLAAAGRLRLHVFGHIHCGYGTHDEFGVRFVNASTCDEQYDPIQPPIVVEI